MRPRIWLILIVQAALVSLVVIAVASRRMPLGVPGEWEWLRVQVSAGLAVVVPRRPGCGRLRAGLSRSGSRCSTTRRHGERKPAWLAGLLAAAIAVQVIIPLGAASGYDLSQVGGGELSSRFGRLFQGRPPASRPRSLEVSERTIPAGFATRIRFTSALIRRV